MKYQEYKVVEIFSSIDGEGLRAGLPCTFIRLHGCNLHCSYCDSRYACEGDDFTTMSLEDIVDSVNNIGIPAITLTGGEPLLEESVYELIRELARRNYWVNIETNGSIDLGALDYLRKNTSGKIMATMDWKCYSSGMTDSMIVDNLDKLNSDDVLKFVVGDDEDLLQMKEILNRYHVPAHVYVSPVFGQIDPKQIVEFLISYELHNVKVQLQLHKFIWSPEMRGV